MKKCFLYITDRLPFLGTRFWRAGAKAHKMALREFLFVVLMSTSPLWLSGLLLLGTDKNFKFMSLIAGGELFLYCTATLACIAWINIKISMDADDDDTPTNTTDGNHIEGTPVNKKRIYPPDKYWFWVIVIIGLMVCVAFYAANLLYKADLLKVEMDPDYVFSLSRWIYFICLFFYHNVLVSEHSAEYFKPLQETSAEHTQKFVAGYAEHRGQS